MKKILIALSSLFLIAETLTTYGQTKVTAPITRNSPLDLTYGTHIDTLGYGGLMVFTSIANRDATPAPVRKAGMIAVVQDSLVYQLQGGITNADWVRVFFTGGAGGGFFANNGLTFTANLLQISGPLVKSTAIQNGAFNFNINGPGNYNTVMFAPGATTFVHALNNGVNPTDKESVFYQPGDAIVLGSTTKQARDSGTYYARSIVVTQADDAGTSFIGSWYPQQIDPNTAPPILPDHTTYVRTSQTGAAGTGRIELYGKTTYFNGDSIQVNTARYASGAGYVLTDVAGNGKLTMQPGSTPSSLTFQQTLNNSDVITKNDTIVGPTFSMNFNTKVVVSKYDTATTQPEFMWVARGDTMAKFPIQSINPNCQSRLISGSVIWDNLLIFHSTVMNYFIGCRNFTAPAGNFTLAPAYPANDRTDIWVVDTLGTISVITGSISGLAPQPDPASQLQVASVFIPAGATTPQDIINTTIYKENHPGEWGGATNIPGAIFDQTTFPFAGDSCTYVPSFTNGQYVTYQATTGNEEDFTQASFVYFYLRLSAPMTTGNMNFSLYLNTGPITAPYTLINGQNGFNQNTINQYQLIAIPASAFTLNGSGTIFNQLNITFTGTGGALRMDNIILQKGGSSLGSGVIDYTGGDGSTARSGHVVARATDYIWSYNSSAFNGDTTYQYHYNSLGILLDSVWVPKDPIFAGTNMNIRDTTVLISGNPVRGYIFDAITGGSVLDTMFQWSVLSIRNTPVVLADTGAHYLVGTTPTGAFTGHANQIAIWTGTVYTFTTAAVGDLLYNVATDLVYQWTGTQWVIVGLAALHQGGDTYGAPIVWGSKDYNPTLSITNSVMSYAIADSTVQNTGVGFGVIRNLPLTKMSSSGVSEGITAIGFKAAGRATTLSYSTALGTNAMAFSTTGGNNTALGAFAMFANTVGTNQVAVGYGAMQQSVTAVDNTAVGYLALSGVLTGQGNVAVGNSAMLHNTSGQLGTAVGISALQANTTGDFNTAVGRASLVSNTTGTTNTATGMNSLFNNTIGNDNAGFGTSAGFANTTGSDNTFLGYRAGNYVSGSGLTNDISNSSIYIGSNSRAQQSNQTNQIVIGTDVSGLGSNTALYGDSLITLSQIMGQVKVPTYGAGSHVAAPAYGLGVLSDGTIVEYTPGGSATLQSAFNSAPSAPQIDAAGNDFIITNATSFENVTISDPSGQGDFGVGNYYGFLSTIQDTTSVGFSYALTDNSGLPSNNTRFFIYSTKSAGGHNYGHSLTLYPEYTLLSGGVDKTKLVLGDAAVLTTTPLNIAAFDGDTLKKYDFSPGPSGTATLSSGTVTVSTARVTTSSLIFVVYNTPSGTLASGLSAPSGSIVNGVSFVINSLTTAGVVNTLDNSTVRWWIIH